MGNYKLNNNPNLEFSMLNCFHTKVLTNMPFSIDLIWNIIGKYAPNCLFPWNLGGGAVGEGVKEKLYTTLVNVVKNV